MPFNFLDKLFWCLLVASPYSEQFNQVLAGEACTRRPEGVTYHLWTFETGALCLALPLACSGEASPEYVPRHAACFHAVAAGVVSRPVLAAVQEREALFRRLASERGCPVEKGILLYDAGQPGETILSLKCEDDSPAFDQRVWLVRVVRDEGWAWQVHHLHHDPRAAPVLCPKSAWKDVAPPLPAVLSCGTDH